MSGGGDNIPTYPQQTVTPDVQEALARLIWPNIRESVFGTGTGLQRGLLDYLGVQRPQWMQPQPGEARSVVAQYGVNPLELAAVGGLRPSDPAFYRFPADKPVSSKAVREMSKFADSLSTPRSWEEAQARIDRMAAILEKHGEDPSIAYRGDLPAQYRSGSKMPLPLEEAYKLRNSFPILIQQQ